MLCEKCNTHPAVVYYKQTLNGITSKYNLCKNCAAISGAHIDANNNLFKSIMLVKSPSSQVQQVLKCHFCGYTYDMIVATCKVGCAQCYTTFAHQLSDSLRRIHGNNYYKDFSLIIKDTPRKTNPIDELRTQLKSAIIAENYEQAAILRDQIKTLEGGEHVVQI